MQNLNQAIDPAVLSANIKNWLKGKEQQSSRLVKLSPELVLPKFRPLADLIVDAEFQHILRSK